MPLLGYDGGAIPILHLDIVDVLAVGRGAERRGKFFASHQFMTRDADSECLDLHFVSFAPEEGFSVMP